MLNAKVVKLTPELAEKWRERNTNNFRKINEVRVSQYANEMRSGNWQLNGEAIEFYEDGSLANGQHRIEAVIRSGATIETVVVYGIKKGIIAYDLGGNRTAGQIARAMGMAINNPRVATASFIYNDGKDNKFGKVEILDYYKSLSEYFDLAYAFANKGIDKQKVLIKAGAISAIWCAIMLNIISNDKLEAFCRITNSGMPFSNYVMEPALVLRNMLIGKELGPSNGRFFMRTSFNVTWQAILRFEKQVKNKYRYKTETDDWQTVIPKAKAIAFLYRKYDEEAGQ